MPKRPNPKEQEKQLLTGLNDFMHRFGISGIEFGNKHAVKKTAKGKPAQPIVQPKKKKK